MTDERALQRLERLEQREAARAASEASRVGGGSGSPPHDPATAPVEEAGGGEAEGFGQAEELLVEHASHGDSQSAHTVLRDQTPSEDDDQTRADGEADDQTRADGEADDERSSETQPGAPV